MTPTGQGWGNLALLFLTNRFTGVKRHITIEP